MMIYIYMYIYMYMCNVEENDTVSRALARLSEVEEKVETLHNDQVLN